jgi:hypothetical protein
MRARGNAKGVRILGGSEGMFPRKNLEFLVSLERYFVYFRKRFEEKLQPKKPFLSRLMLLDRENIFVKRCTVHANTTAK